MSIKKGGGVCVERQIINKQMNKRAEADLDWLLSDICLVHSLRHHLLRESADLETY